MFYKSKIKAVKFAFCKALKKIVDGLLIVTFLPVVSFGQGFNEVSDSIWSKVNDVYRLLSIIVAVAALFYGSKNVIEGLKGEQGAWGKFGAILLVSAIWFFAIPPFISFLHNSISTGIR